MRVYTTAEVARLLRISRDTVYRWMRAGKISGSRVLRVGGTKVRVRLWTERDLEKINEYIKENYRKGRGRKKNRAVKVLEAPAPR